MHVLLLLFNNNALLSLLPLLSVLLLQAVVFGVTCYFDVQDMMEKRVRSRFSNRKVFLNGLCAAQQVRNVSACFPARVLLQQQEGLPPQPLRSTTGEGCLCLLSC
jgi:hypothetical protein